MTRNLAKRDRPHVPQRLWIALAIALLGTMVVLFIVGSLVPEPGFWIRLVRATAEAAIELLG